MSAHSRSRKSLYNVAKRSAMSTPDLCPLPSVRYIREGERRDTVIDRPLRPGRLQSSSLSDLGTAVLIAFATGGFILILRIYTACPGCDAPTMLRIGVAVPPGERQPFALVCPKCSSTIRGELITTKEATVSARLDDAPDLPEDASQDWQVITSHPAFPFMPSATTSPFMDIMSVLGDAGMPYFGSVARFNSIVTEDWPQLRRAYQFYLSGDWNRFDTAMSRLLEEDWPGEPNMLIRHDAVHRLLVVTLASLDPSGRYAEMQQEVWERAQPSGQLIDYLRQDAVQVELLKLQKRIFSQLAHLIDIRQAWLPALPLIWVELLNIAVPKDWRLPGDDFPVLRGAYQQNFELSCQALPLLVVTENAADGRLATSIHDDASSWVPGGLSQSSRPPRTLAQFKKLTAEAKEAFLDRFPVTEESWLGVFDRSIRNAIAHADVDEIISDGKISTGKGATLTYMHFVASVARQIQLLLLWLNLIKLFRVYKLLSDQNKAK